MGLQALRLCCLLQDVADFRLGAAAMVRGLDSDGPMHLIGQVSYIHVGHLIYHSPISINALILWNRHHIAKIFQHSYCRTMVALQHFNHGLESGAGP